MADFVWFIFHQFAYAFVLLIINKIINNYGYCLILAIFIFIPISYPSFLVFIIIIIIIIIIILLLGVIEGSGLFPNSFNEKVCLHHKI